MRAARAIGGLGWATAALSLSLVACRDGPVGLGDGTDSGVEDSQGDGSHGDGLDGPGTESGSSGADPDSESGGSDTTGPTEDEDLRPYNVAPYAATHNSYAGNVGAGNVGTIGEQLDAGVRFVELDVHTDDYATQGYTIGHDAPGDEVALGSGNPDSTQLPAWLDAIAQWSDTDPTHAPITILVDFKDRPSSDHFDDGNLAAFNAVLTAALSNARLFAPPELSDRAGQWPTVDALRGRVIVVLSGDEDAQLDYRRDRGDNPAIAINALGQVVQVHQSQSDGDQLWLWTGQVEGDGGIRWHRHSRYDTGNHPAIALNDEGLLVEVHEDPDPLDDQLWYRVGRLDAQYEILWSTAQGQPFPGNDDGVDPSVAFVALDSDVVREVHQSPGGAQHWYWAGQFVDVAAGTIPWARPDGDGTTADEQYPIAEATFMGVQYMITAGDDGPLSEVLTVHGVTTERVRYEQLAFGSARASSQADLLADGLAFFGDDGSSASGRQFITDMNDNGGVTRLWNFTPEAPVDAGLPINFGATDLPYADAYQQYCAAVLCAQ